MQAPTSLSINRDVVDTVCLEMVEKYQFKKTRLQELMRKNLQNLNGNSGGNSKDQ